MRQKSASPAKQRASPAKRSEQYPDLTLANVNQEHFDGLKQVVAKHQMVADQLQEDNKTLFAEKQALYREVQASAVYIQGLEEKCLEANKTSLNLLAALRDKEAENETLKQYIIDLKARIAVYIPVKGDVIDQKLAEYINNYPDRQKLKIMFMRESSGVYEFGSKRVRVEV